MQTIWYLEGINAERSGFWRVPVVHTPFTIGRTVGCDLTLSARGVSGRHAEIVRDGELFTVRDLDSKNGTLRNGRPVVGEEPLVEGDSLQFAGVEFRLMKGGEGEPLVLDPTPTALSVEIPPMLVGYSRGLPDLIAEGAVSCMLQPILDLIHERVIGYEVLGRGAFDGLPVSPIDLFEAAEIAGLECELSRLFRREGVAGAVELPGGTTFFLNTHAAELSDPQLLPSIAELQQSYPQFQYVIEVHERAILNVDHVRELRHGLEALGIGLAYDDFGAGRSRLSELAAVPPDYLKFDRSLIGHVDRAGAAHRRLLETLVSVAAEFGSSPLAEGVETRAEAETCARLGFRHAQGYLFGRPAPALTHKLT